ncbi:hypothetical protein HNP12_000233 [Aeromonas hydrophila]|uniref:hypothetical protein n=1 Tax=Aeromonas hydrophila TaxID=644 RepID=UPI002167EC80|nr:hypothetical protein [Aeromonas hydrophila]MCS3766194.1 hypothetical protein [Aeromonas hydrophila]
MFHVSDFSKEAPFYISEYDYVFAGVTGHRTINIISYDVDAAVVLYKRMQKANKTKSDLYKVSINANDETQMAIIIGAYDTSTVKANYVFSMTPQEARGVIPPIVNLLETNWLMLKHITDSLAAAGFLNQEGQALKEQRDIWRQQIDGYGTDKETSHEVTMIETDDVTIKPILDLDVLNKLV